MPTEILQCTSRGFLAARHETTRATVFYFSYVRITSRTMSRSEFRENTDPQFKTPTQLFSLTRNVNLNLTFKLQKGTVPYLPLGLVPTSPLLFSISIHFIISSVQGYYRRHMPVIDLSEVRKKSSSQQEAFHLYLRSQCSITNTKSYIIT